MRVCIVTSFPPEKGNLAEYGFHLTRSLSKSPRITEIVVLANGKNLNKDQRADKSLKPSIETEGADKVTVIRCWENDNMLSLVSILKQIQKRDPDIVLLNSHMMSWGKGRLVNFLGATLPFILTKVLRKKVVISLHNMIEAVDYDSIALKPSWLDLIGGRTATKFILSSDRVIVTLERFKTLLKDSYGKDNVVHIPHGTLGRVERAPLPREKRILTFGFWRDTKDLPLLLEAYKDLKEEDPSIELTVAGENHPNFPDYLRKIREKHDVEGVKYIGYVPEEDLRSLFQSAYMIVLPYLTTTGTSGVVHLASSFGTPILATDLDDMKRISIEEDIKMIMFPLSDKEALKESIRRMFKERDLIENMIRHNYNISGNLSFDRMAEKHIDVFESVLGKSR